MRRRLLYNEKTVEPVPTFWGYEIVIDEFYYAEASPHDTTLSPIYRYHYHPIYNDESTGEDVHVTQNDENPDFLNVEFSIDDSSSTAVADAGTKINSSNGILSFSAWEEIQERESARLLATVNMKVWYVAPNEAIRGRDERSTDAIQESIQIKWQTPQVELYYDDAPAQPDEEGGEIILKPTVKWTQIGYDDDGIIYTATSDTITSAQYVFSSTGDISVDVNGNVTVPSSTIEEKHNVGTVTVGVTNKYVSEGEQTGYANWDIYQEAYEEPQPQEGTSFPMDILMLNNETHKQEIYDRWNNTYEDFPKETYTPIGIILTPESEDGTVSGYGSGWMGVMALEDVSLSGSEDIFCGNSAAYEERMRTAEESALNGEDVPSPSLLPYSDNDGVPVDGIVNVIDDTDGVPDYGNVVISVATDRNDTVAAPSDAWAGYASEEGHKTMSPYSVSSDWKQDNVDFEGYNTEAYEECVDYGGRDRVRSALSDYNGELNSLEILLGKSFGLSREWIENTTSNSNTQSTDCPAVEACWKYAPEGTAQGGWHLPALGELSLMAARFEKINETLSMLNGRYGVSVSLLKDTEVPYLSSTHFVTQYSSGLEDVVRTAYALFPDIDGDMGYNRVFTTSISGAETGGHVRPFKKIRSGAGAYELMPAHYTDTLCNGDSKREWFGQKFIVSFRRGCLSVGTDQLGRYNYNITSEIVRIYGYRIKSGSNTTRIDDNARVLAELWVDGLDSATSSTWPTYSGDEKGLNIVGRFTTKYQFGTDGAFDEEKDDYVDMDTDEFDRDGTVEPGWYVLAGVAIYGYTPDDISGVSDWHILPNTGNCNVAVVKDEIDIVNGVESKEAFFDEIRTTPYKNYPINLVTEYPFYVGQFDRPVALLFSSYQVTDND